MPSDTIVFLDFDGVCHPWGGDEPRFTPRCLVPLGEALAGTRVVVSSTWRESHPLAELRGHLGAIGALVVGATPVLLHLPMEHRRYREAQAWLHAAGHHGPWAALDDDLINYPADAPLYLCDATTGFTAADVHPFRALLAGMRQV